MRLSWLPLDRHFLTQSVFGSPLPTFSSPVGFGLKPPVRFFVAATASKDEIGSGPFGRDQLGRVG